MGMETESGRDGEMEARREMGGGAKEEWRERERDRDRQTERQGPLSKIFLAYAILSGFGG